MPSVDCTKPHAFGGVEFHCTGQGMYATFLACRIGNAIALQSVTKGQCTQSLCTWDLGSLKWVSIRMLYTWTLRVWIQATHNQKPDVDYPLTGPELDLILCSKPVT